MRIPDEALVSAKDPHEEYLQNVVTLVAQLFSKIGYNFVLNRWEDKLYFSYVLNAHIVLQEGQAKEVNK